MNNSVVPDELVEFRDLQFPTNAEGAIVSSIAAIDLGAGNIIGDGRFEDILGSTRAAHCIFDVCITPAPGGPVPIPYPNIALATGSSAVGAGPNGTDAGADVPAGASISGEPDTVTRSDSATLTIGGPAIVSYQWSLDGGVFSAETDVATSIVLAGLSDGEHSVRVIGRNEIGVLQQEAAAAVSKTWNVDTAGVLQTTLVINEILAVNDSGTTGGIDHEGTNPDLIELFNPSTTPISLADMSISDDPTVPRQFIFPAGTTIGAGEYLVLYANDVDGTSGLHLGFGLSGQSGDSVYLYDTLAAGSSVIDQITFGFQLPNRSIGRIGRGDAVGDKPWGLTTPTFGGENATVLTGDPSNLQINEWLASTDVLFNSDFIEIYNSDPFPVDMGGLHLTDNRPGNPTKKELTPLSFVAGGGWQILEADENSSQGAEHLNFRLSHLTEMIAITDASGEPIDIVFYGPQLKDISEGRNGDGNANFTQFTLPNLGLSNGASGETQTFSVVSIEDNWRYNQAQVDLGTAWKEVSYNPDTPPVGTAWSSGPALLYVENSSLPAAKNTPLTLGATTYYFRTTFTLDSDPTEATIDLQTVIDDGAVVYLNGIELLRLGMEDLPAVIEYDTFANRTINDAGFESFLGLSGANLVQGENILAIEVHQTTASSSDIVFGLTMDVKIAGETVVPENPVLGLLDDLRVTELMYNPIGGSEFEYVELKNIGSETINLDGVRLDNGVNYEFGDVDLAAGAYIVVASDLTAFASRYGTAINVVGPFGNNLSNGGENFESRLPYPFSARIQDFTYDDDPLLNWPTTPDGLGPSLQIINELGSVASWQVGDSWRAGIVGGSPGRDESDSVPPIVTIDSLTTNDTTPQLTGTVNDPTATIALTVDGNPYSTTNLGDGTWRLVDDTIAPALGEGTYDVIASVTNTFGTGSDTTTNELVIVTTPVDVDLRVIELMYNPTGGDGF